MLQCQNMGCVVYLIVVLIQQGLKGHGGKIVSLHFSVSLLGFCHKYWITRCYVNGFNYFLCIDHPLATLTMFKGLCRYGYYREHLFYSIFAPGAKKCHDVCKMTSSCVAFTFETSVIKMQKQYSNCYLYKGGPYTFGNGEIGMTCYVVPKGIFFYYPNCMLFDKII